MSIHDPYEQHRAAFGAELRRVAPTVRTRRRRVLTLGGASMALAGAVTAAVVLFPTTGSRLDVLSEAQAAIATPPDSIVHYSLRWESGYPQRKVDQERYRGCKNTPGEVWRSTSSGPPRFRMRIPLNPCSVARLGDRIATGTYDIAYADRTQTVLSPSDGFQQVTTDLPEEADGQLATTMLLPTADSRLSEGSSFDPVARIRSMLRDGSLTDAGEIRGEGGRTVRRLVGEFTEDRGDPNDPTPSLVKVDYRVDPQTFAPVQMSTTSMQSVPEDVDAPVGESPMVKRELTEVTTFDIYETVPLTDETERLLTVQPEAGTETTTRAYRPGLEYPEPSAAEEARAKAAAEAQIAAGTRVRIEP